MDQADSVHSTPPTSASNPSRRGFLSKAATVAAGSAVLTVAAATDSAVATSHGPPDPIFAAIEAHKAARAVVYSKVDAVHAAEREITGAGVKLSAARGHITPGLGIG